MTTLPRLPPLFRGSGASSQQQTAPIKYQTPVVPIGRNISVFPQNQNIQLQGIKEITLRKYESYVSQIRQLDRNFNLSFRKLDQGTSRTISRLVDTVSALSSEMQQLKNQSTILSRKLKNITQVHSQIVKEGLQSFLKPLDEAFASFGKEFEGSQNNIETLFNSHENKINTVLETYKAIYPITKSIVDVRESVNELIKVHKNAFENFQDAKTEVLISINEKYKSATLEIKSRFQNLASKIQIMEERSSKTFDFTQEYFNDSQAAQLELRTMFNQTIEKTQNEFKERINSLRDNVSSTIQTQYSSIDSIRNMLSQNTEFVNEIKKQKVKEFQNTNSPSRVSLRPDIELLKKKCDELELEYEKMMQNQPKKQRIFHQSLPDGSVKTLVINEDGTATV